MCVHDLDTIRGNFEKIMETVPLQDLVEAEIQSLPIEMWKGLPVKTVVTRLHLKEQEVLTEYKFMTHEEATNRMLTCSNKFPPGTCLGSIIYAA